MTDQHEHAAHPDSLKEELHKHLQEIPHKLREIPSHLEQQPPNKPSFLTVVILSGVAIIILFVLALIALHVFHGRMESPFRAHPSSQLVLPRATSPATRA